MCSAADLAKGSAIITFVDHRRHAGVVTGKWGSVRLSRFVASSCILVSKPAKDLKSRDNVLLEWGTVGSGRTRSSYESYTLAYVFFSFAIALLIAWAANEDWVLFIPVFLIEVGIGYLVLGFVIWPRELNKRPVMRNAYYYIIWGSIGALIGIEWLINRQFPGNIPLLIALFVIWMGVISVGLAIGRNRERSGTPRQ